MTNTERIITAVTAGRNPSSCTVVFEDGAREILSTDIVVKYRLGKGTVLSPGTCAEIAKDQRLIDLKRAAYAYAAYKPRSVRQVADKLKALDYSAEEIESALGFLVDFGLLDDEKFALMFCKDYLLRKSASRNVLVNELRRKGVSAETARKTVDSIYPGDNEHEQALRAAMKKMRSLERKEPAKRKQSLFAFLCRQGFDFDVIRNVINELLPES